MGGVTSRNVIMSVPNYIRARATLSGTFCATALGILGSSHPKARTVTSIGYRVLAVRRLSDQKDRPSGKPEASHYRFVDWQYSVGNLVVLRPTFFFIVRHSVSTEPPPRPRAQLRAGSMYSTRTLLSRCGYWIQCMRIEP